MKALSDASREYWLKQFQQESDKKLYSEQDMRKAFIAGGNCPIEEPKRGYVVSETKLLGCEFILKDGSKQFIPKQSTLEEAAERHCLINSIPTDQMIVKYDRSCEFETPVTMFVQGIKHQQEQDKNKFSEEDMKQAFLDGMFCSSGDTVENAIEEWFEQFKKK